LLRVALSLYLMMIMDCRIEVKAPTVCAQTIKLSPIKMERSVCRWLKTSGQNLSSLVSLALMKTLRRLTMDPEKAVEISV